MITKIETSRFQRQVYTMKETAEMLGMSENSVRRAMREGLIPHKKIRGRIVIPKTVFHTWLEAQGEAV